MNCSTGDIFETFTLDRECDKNGCAKLHAEPHLREFDECFSGNSRMGDVDGIIERKGHILIIEWKNAAKLESFEKFHMAQVITAKSFTANNYKHQWWFVIGNPQTMEVRKVRAIKRGDWHHDDWLDFDLERLKTALKDWWAKANG